MTARLQEARAAATPAPAELFRETRQRSVGCGARRVPAAPAAAGWPATQMDRDQVLGMLRRAPFTVGNPGTQRWRFRGAALAVTWLGDQPGSTWQRRWLASGAETAGADWKREGARWLDDHGVHVLKRLDLLSVGLALAASADIIRPSLSWLAVSGISPWALARTLEGGRDPAGIARLRAAVGEAGQITAAARDATIGRAAVLIAAKGGTLAGVTVGDFLELLDAEQQGHGRRRDYSAVSWRLLRQAGGFGPDAPASLAQLLTIGQRSPAELIDRYQLSCRPVRDLLAGYLQERQPALDHTSLDALAQQLGRNFWADLEHHHPGISSLNLPPGAATAWKQRLRTKNTAPQRGGPAAQAPRLTCRHTLIAVRAFYLDLACWATEDPARWGPWAAPSPVSKADINTRKEERRRKSRMDARTRERLPVLPVLVRSAAGHHARTAAVLAAACRTPPGGTFTAGGQAFTRPAARRPGIRIWAEDADGRRHDLIWEEDHAFWTWAIIEVLRATGIRVEELLELTHHSLVQYRLPATGELVPLLQIAPSKTDAERLLVVSPDLADVLSAIITRLQQPDGKIPLTARYDGHEHLWQPPAPLLFQRRGGTETRHIAVGTVRNMLSAALARAGLTDAAGQPLTFTPHDFRRMFITDAKMGRIASDASFGSSREHALPAAQRAALRCPRPARPPRGCSDLGLHGPPGSDATTMQLIPLRGPHHHCACWHRDASGSSQLHPVHHRQTRRTAPGRHRSCKGRAGLPHHRSRHAPDLATSRSCCTRCIPAPGDGCSRGRQLARRAARHAGRPTRRGRGRHASQSPTGGRSWPGPATRLGRSVPVFTNLGSSLQAPR